MRDSGIHLGVFVLLFAFTTSLVHNDRPGKVRPFCCCCTRCSLSAAATCLLFPFFHHVSYLPHVRTHFIKQNGATHGCRLCINTLFMSPSFRNIFSASKGQWLRRTRSACVRCHRKKNHFTPIALRWHLKHFFGKHTQLMEIERLNLIWLCRPNCFLTGQRSLWCSRFCFHCYQGFHVVFTPTSVFINFRQGWL